MQGKIRVMGGAEFIYRLTRVSEYSGIESIFDWMDNWLIEKVQKERISFQQTPSQEKNIIDCLPTLSQRQLGDGTN